MAGNPYKDEKGHYTSKENDGGPCKHEGGNTSQERKGLVKETLVDKFNDAHLYNDGGKFQLALSNGKTEEFDTKNEAIDYLSKYSNRDYSWAKDEDEDYENDLENKLSPEQQERLDKIKQYKNYKEGSFEEHVNYRLNEGDSYEEAVDNALYSMETYGDKPAEEDNNYEDDLDEYLDKFSKLPKEKQEEELWGKQNKKRKYYKKDGMVHELDENGKEINVHTEEGFNEEINGNYDNYEEVEAPNDYKNTNKSNINRDKYLERISRTNDLKTLRAIQNEATYESDEDLSDEDLEKIIDAVDAKIERKEKSRRAYYRR